MIAGSARFQAALLTHHTVVSRVRFMQNGTPGQALQIASGEVIADDKARVRRTCKFVLHDLSLVPVSGSSLLLPYGTEVFIERGIQFADGTAEYLPLGYFGLDKVAVKDTGAGIELSAEGLDRSRRVARNAFLDHSTVAAGTNLATAVTNVLTAQYPGAVLAISPTTFTVAAQVFEAGKDPWEACVDMASSGAMELFVNPTGTVVMQPVPDPATAASVATYAEGSACTVTDFGRDLDDALTYNVVIVTGEHPNTADPPRGIAQDTNPASPTYVNGVYGKVVKSIVDRTVMTDAQALAVATAELNRSLGLTEVVQIGGQVHPGHEPGDIVTLSRARAGINARYSLGQVTIPLGPSAPMAATARRRSY